LSFHQLNDPAGSAADALLALLFRRALDASTAEERVTNFPARSRLDPAISALLDRSLSELWGGVELRFAIEATILYFTTPDDLAKKAAVSVARAQTMSDLHAAAKAKGQGEDLAEAAAELRNTEPIQAVTAICGSGHHES
jgi:hypothetical protein